MSQEINSQNQESSAKDMSIVARIWNVFVSPAAAFQAVREKPKWLIPLLISLVITSVIMYMVTPIIIAEGKDKTEQTLRDRGMSSEQVDQAVAQGAKIQKFVIAPTAAVGGFIMTLIMAAIALFLSNVLLGGAGKYGQMLGVVVYSGFIGVLGFLIKLPMILSQKTMNIHFSFATFMSDAAKDTFLYKLLANFDLFNFWTIAVTSIGVAVVAGLKAKKVWPWVLILNILFWLAGAGLASAFGR